MTLDEAIIHAEEVAEINKTIADNTETDNWMDIAQCEKCAEEHRQLAEWLKELKERREQPEIIRCEECKWKQGAECVRFADVRPFPDDYCSRAERKEN